MPKKVGGPRRRGANATWEQMDEITIWCCEAGLFQLTPFADMEEMLASYPSWREEYLEYKVRKHEAAEPVKPTSPDPSTQHYLEASYRSAYQTWVGRGYETPRLERLYREHRGI